MVNVVFCGFGADQDKRVFARPGDLLSRVAASNGVVIDSENDAVEIIELTTGPSGDQGSNVDPDGWKKDAQTTYMEDTELEKLVEMGAISTKEAEVAQQYARQTPVRIADQCIIKDAILVKPYKK